MNKLSLNLDKTVGMFFHANKRMKAQSWTPKIYINKSPLKFTQHIKYLGFMIDCRLSFKEHVVCLSSRLRKWVGIFRKINPLLTLSAKYSLYNSLFYPLILYGVELYGTSSKANISSLQILQNKTLKALFGYPRLYPTQNMYKQLGILDINTLFKIRASLFMKTLLSQPDSLNIHYIIKEYCSPMGITHKYDTRDKLMFNLKFEKISYTLSSTFKILLVWNSIPAEIKKMNSYTAFKCSVYKLFFLSSQLS
jgi:hypothetical protein